MISIRLSTPEDASQCLAIWRNAVLATHDFLSPEDFEAIERMVADAYLPTALLWLAVDEADRPVGFLGLSGTHIDSLFVDPSRHGSGVGRLLVEHARGYGPTLTVDVNEQNRSAIAFYEHLGFRRVGRSPLDDQGRPYPLLHLSAGSEA